jgi:hypothetical protein
MLTIEHDALEFLAETLREGGLGAEVGLRLLADEDRFELVPDRPRAADRVFRHGGEPVVLVGPEVGRAVAGRVLERDGGSLRLGWQGD